MYDEVSVLDRLSDQTGFTHISTISGPNRLKYFGGYKIHVWYFLWRNRQGHMGVIAGMMVGKYVVG